MKLKKVIDNLTGIVKVEGKTNLEISGMACDSKAVKPGYLFVALKGSKVNGADFIDEAIERGASAILLDACDKGIFKRGDTFIYVKDAVDVLYYFLQHPGKGGIFNLGCGVARSWNDLANAMFSAIGKNPHIEYIDMPETLRPKYQYFTEAKMGKLRKLGYKNRFTSLEDAVKDYSAYLRDRKYV